MSSSSQEPSEHERDARTPTIAPLFLEIQTLTIKGKQITPALLRQFVVEEVIDPLLPRLRGTPLAWLNVHDKTCTSLPPHLHVLWKKGEVYRVCSLMLSIQDDTHAVQRMASLEQRCFDLCDLLALILAQKHRYDTDPLTQNERTREQRAILTLDEYILSLSPNVSYMLKKLETARRQHDLDTRALPADTCATLLAQALTVRTQLLEQGVILGHPTLDSGFDNDTLLPLPLPLWDDNESEDNDNVQDEDEDATEQLASFLGDGETHPQVSSQRKPVRWERKRGHRSESSISSSAIKELLRTHASALLAVLSDVIVQQRLQDVQTQVNTLATALHIVETTSEQQLEGDTISLSAVQVWKMYEETEQHSDEYPHRWQTLYDHILATDQLFLLE